MIELQAYLKNGPVEVTFTKVSDGSTRVMKCTLDEHLIPQTAFVSEGKRESNDAVQCVYDLDKEAWRSFRLENVISYRNI